jgi:hypothetical protein
MIERNTDAAEECDKEPVEEPEPEPERVPELKMAANGFSDPDEDPVLSENNLPNRSARSNLSFRVGSDEDS